MKPSTRGSIFALLAFISWGVFPLYWKLLQHVSPVQILLNRIVWSGVFFLLLLVWRHRTGWMRELRSVSKRSLAWFSLTACLISANWGVYIYAVNTGHIVEASLGYFLNPLVTIFLGTLILKEKLSPLRWAAVALAGFGVLQLAMIGKGFPWIALFLAGSFAFYGLVRKRAVAAPLTASTLESLVLTVPAAAVLAFGPFPAQDLASTALLILGGAVTALPLLWFVEAARLMPLSSIGVMQYISPTMQLLIGVVVFSEPFTAVQGRSFVLIWAALFLYAFRPGRFMPARARR